MVDSLKKRFSHPVVLASLLCALLIYTHAVPLRKGNAFVCAIPEQSLTGVSGSVKSNPVKTSNGKWYSLTLSCKNAQGFIHFSGKENPMNSEARGEIKILVPSETAESLYPGKLYSRKSGAILLEQGENVFFEGRWNENLGCFVSERASALEGVGSVFYAISHFRAWCRLVFKRLMFSWGKAGALILSLLSGSREYTEKSVGEAFRRAGLSHVLALSGMHLSFFSSLTGGIGKKLAGKKNEGAFVLLGILGFVWFAGNSPSLFRALLCSLFMFFSRKLFLKEADLCIVLCASFLLHSALFPEHVLSVAFMLSYGALFGILLLGEFFTSLTTFILPQKISASLSSSLAAQTATAPLTAVLFKTFTPVGIIASVVVSPLISFFMTAAIFSIALCLLMPFLSPLFGDIMNVIYKVIVSCVLFFSRAEPVTF